MHHPQLYVNLKNVIFFVRLGELAATSNMSAFPVKKIYFSTYCCIRRDGTRFDIQCAFNYSDNLVIINQVTPVTIQNKNHLEIIQIRTQIKLVIW